MDERDHVLECKCRERDGEIVRNVTFAPLTKEKLAHYWEKLSPFPTLFNRHIKNFEDFVATFIHTDKHGEIYANGIIWEVDDVGIFWITDISAGYQATGHFTFWDRKFRGREELFRKMLVYIFEEFGFHRIILEVPLHSQRICDFVEGLGFIKEGRLRKATMYRDQWWDVNLYSILEEEAAKWAS
jgi:RimJ/RimL family protein N-acetyltransferase